MRRSTPSLDALAMQSPHKNAGNAVGALSGTLEVLEELAKDFRSRRVRSGLAEIHTA